MSVQDDILNLLQKLLAAIQDLPSRLKLAPSQIHIVTGLSELSENLGLLMAGEFRSGNGKEPGSGFSGMRLAYPPVTYTDVMGTLTEWNLVGIENDVLQFGVRASDGKALAGGGTIILSEGGMQINTPVVEGMPEAVMIFCGAPYNALEDTIALIYAEHIGSVSRFTIGVNSNPEFPTALFQVVVGNQRFWISSGATGYVEGGYGDPTVFLADHFTWNTKLDIRDGLQIGTSYTSDPATLLLKEGSAPGTPATGYGALYVKTDGKLYFKNDSGTETCLTP